MIIRRILAGLVAAGVTLGLAGCGPSAEAQYWQAVHRDLPLLTRTEALDAGHAYCDYEAAHPENITMENIAAIHGPLQTLDRLTLADDADWYLCEK